MNTDKDIESLKEVLLLAQKESGFLTPDQAADYLHISKSMIYKLGSLNVFPRYKPTHGLVYYKKRDLDAWLEKGLVETSDSTNDHSESIKKMLDKNSKHNSNYEN